MDPQELDAIMRDKDEERSLRECGEMSPAAAAGIPLTKQQQGGNFSETAMGPATPRAQIH